MLAASLKNGNLSAQLPLFQALPYRLLAHCASIDGCDVTLRLVGMFWHSRRVVFDLAANYLQARIPEIADVVPFSDANLDDARTQAPDFNGDRQEIERLGHEPWDAVTIRHRPGLTFTGYNVY